MSDNEDLLDRNERFSLRDKKKILLFICIVGILLVLWLMVKVTNPQKDLKPTPTLAPLSLDTSTLGDDEFQKFQMGLKSQDEVNQGQQEEIARLAQGIDSLKKEMELNLATQIEDFQKAAKEHMKSGNPRDGGFRYPEPPGAGVADTTQYEKRIEAPPTSYPIEPRLSREKVEVKEDRLIGGLGWIAGTPEPAKKEKKTEKYYLPPSFFNAKLLTGIDALTSKQGKDNLEQIFFMVDAPAVLPNYIKKDLSGCFVVANAYGNLAKERVQVQAVNLSCLSADGSAVIDEPILGFVTDEGDGKRDLAGNVVSKDGSKIGWLVAASVIGEVGNSVTMSSFEQSENLLGTSTVLNTDKLGERAAGSSIQSGAESYKEIIMEYIKQSGPVVEIGPLKNATIFVQEGVWLNVKSREETDNA